MSRRPPILVSGGELVMMANHLQRHGVLSESVLSLPEFVSVLFVGYRVLHVLHFWTLMTDFTLFFKLVGARAHFLWLADSADLGERIFPEGFRRFDFAWLFHLLSLCFSRFVSSCLEFLFIQVLCYPSSLVGYAVSTSFTGHPGWLSLFSMPLLLTVADAIVFPLNRAADVLACRIGESSRLRKTGRLGVWENRVLRHSTKLRVHSEWSLNSETAFDRRQSQRPSRIFKGHFRVLKIVEVISSSLSLRSELLNYVGNSRRLNVFLPQLEHPFISSFVCLLSNVGSSLLRIMRFKWVAYEAHTLHHYDLHWVVQIDGSTVVLRTARK